MTPRPRRLLRERLRLVLLALIISGLAPGTWLRTPLPPPNFTAPLLQTVREAPKGFTALKGTDMTLRGAWRLDSRNAHFGGYSALIALPNGRMLAGSDRGRLLEMPLPEAAEPGTPVRFSFFPGTDGGPKTYADLEALAYDRKTQNIWAAFEQNGPIVRFASNAPKASLSAVAAPAMKDWPNNGGPETMVRLADGRFIVLAESSYYESRLALLFAGDPVEGAIATAFRFKPPAGYSPVDGTALPDGRVLILVRRVDWGLPPRFATGLVVADPSQITAGGMWSGELIATIGGADLHENFEGIAAIKRKDGSIDLYLIADDNLSAFQETLMLKLNWRPSHARKPVSKSAHDSKKAR